MQVHFKESIYISSVLLTVASLTSFFFIFSNVAVLGAGLMGAGIVQVSKV